MLLVVAGAAKIARPAPTAELLGALGVPALPSVAIAIGLMEIATGIIALAIGGAAIAAVTGALYAAFAVAVVRAIAVGAPSCGCFGRTDAPPSLVHVIGNIVFAGASFAAIGASTPLEVMDDQPAGGVAFVVLIGVIAGLALIVFTALPEAMAARRPAHRHPFRVHE